MEQNKIEEAAKRNKYWKRLEFLEAWIIVVLSKFLHRPKFLYGWWQSRLNLIKRNEI